MTRAVLLEASTTLKVAKRAEDGVPSAAAVVVIVLLLVVVVLVMWGRPFL